MNFDFFSGEILIPEKPKHVLRCGVSVALFSIRRWYKYVEGSTAKQLVKLDDRVKQVSGTLIIKEAKVEDSGKYLCNVNNSVGGESVETVLTVTGKQQLPRPFSGSL